MSALNRLFFLLVVVGIAAVAAWRVVNELIDAWPLALLLASPVILLVAAAAIGTWRKRRKHWTDRLYD